MAVNFAKKFESKTSDLLRAKRKSTMFTNSDYEWTGVNSIVVTTMTDPTIGNYNSAGGANRYGNPTEVEDTEQEWTLSRDRAWTKSIDKKNSADKMMIKKPGKYLAQATKNILVPEIDTYVFQTIVTEIDDAITATTLGADHKITNATSTANVYTNFVDLKAAIVNDEAPEEGLVAAATPQWLATYKKSGTLDSSDLGLEARKSGIVGKIDGVSVVVVPESRMPAATDLIIAHPKATCMPEKLIDYTLHDNPPGISGDLMEYRHRYDTFVDSNWLVALAVHKTA
jgi:hypothetical protein